MAGNEKAIAAVLNQRFHDLGAAALVHLKSERLQIVLESTPVLEKNRALQILRDTLPPLDVPVVSIQVMGKIRGGARPVWTESMTVLRPRTKRFQEEQSHHQLIRKAKEIEKDLGQVFAQHQVQVAVTGKSESQLLEIMLLSRLSIDEQSAMTLIERELVKHAAYWQHARIVAMRGAQQTIWQARLNLVQLGKTSAVRQSKRIAANLLERPGVMGWQALTIGGICALILCRVAFLKFLLNYLVIAIHELGHTLTAWLFGYVAVPPFDFSSGGSVPFEFVRTGWGVGLLYGAIAYGLFLLRQRPLGLGVAIGAVLLHISLLMTQWHQFAILAMGHGLELIIAGVFLYRALTGSACSHVFERSIYAAVGWFILMCNWQLAGNLLSNATQRATDIAGNWPEPLESDFVLLSEVLGGLDVRFCALILGLGGMGTVLGAVLAAYHRNVWKGWWRYLCAFR
ncbi:MAG: hypothetical protein AAGG02_09285 [Cyanobacteria bacterium P01_H01_bin.15]